MSACNSWLIGSYIWLQNNHAKCSLISNLTSFFWKFSVTLSGFFLLFRWRDSRTQWLHVEASTHHKTFNFMVPYAISLCVYYARCESLTFLLFLQKPLCIFEFQMNMDNVELIECFWSLTHNFIKHKHISLFVRGSPFSMPLTEDVSRLLILCDQQINLLQYCYLRPLESISCPCHGFLSLS